MRLLAVLLYASVLAANDAAAIMAKVADRMESAAGARKQYVYRQQIRTNLIRSKDAREYSVFPTEKGTDKKIAYDVQTP